MFHFLQNEREIEKDLTTGSQEIIKIIIICPYISTETMMHGNATKYPLHDPTNRKRTLLK